MPLSNAEKQRRYRQKKKETTEQTKLVCYLPSQAAFNLRCLTKHYGMTQAELLTKLLAEADEAVTSEFINDDSALEQYIAGGDRSRKARPKPESDT